MQHFPGISLRQVTYAARGCQIAYGARDCQVSYGVREGVKYRSVREGVVGKFDMSEPTTADQTSTQPSNAPAEHRTKSF